MKRIVIASNNSGKLQEFCHLLEPLGIQVLPQSAFNVTEAEEPYYTFVENALAKARHASKYTGLPALAVTLAVLYRLSKKEGREDT